MTWGGELRSAASGSPPEQAEKRGSTAGNGGKHQSAPQPNFPLFNLPVVVLVLVIVVHVSQHVLVFLNVLLDDVIQYVEGLSVCVDVQRVGCTLEGNDLPQHGRVHCRNRVKCPQVNLKSPVSHRQAPGGAGRPPLVQAEGVSRPVPAKVTRPIRRGAGHVP